MRKMFGVLLLAVIVSIFVSYDARAEEGRGWLGSSIIEISRFHQDPPSLAILCPGAVAPVRISSVASRREACIFGDSGGVRVARYYDAFQTLRYAISMRAETQFYELRGMCEGTSWCAYSQRFDMFISHDVNSSGETGTEIVDNFTRRLSRGMQDGDVYYFLPEEAERQSLFSRGTEVGALSLSSNGEWLALFIPHKGVARLSLTTRDIHWLEGYSFEPGYTAGDDDRGPFNTLAISNNGRVVAGTNRELGLVVYDITGSCGYRGNSALGQLSCPSQAVTDKRAGQPYSDTFVSRFTDDSKKLVAYSDSGEGIDKIFLTPTHYYQDSTPLYVAFGDSFASGEGEYEDKFYLPESSPSSKCHVSRRSYAYLLGASWGIPTINKACSGATSVEVKRVVHSVISAGEPPPSIMSIGMGGNDIDLVGKLKGCLGTGVCQWASTTGRANTVREIDRLLPDFISALSAIQNNTSAPLFVVGYPSVINSTPQATCDVVLGALLSREERQYFEESIQYLNTVLEYASRYAGATYIDVFDSFRGERLCDSSSSFMNGIRLGDDIAPIPFLQNYKAIGAESFHPTPEGHARLARELFNKLKGAWQKPRTNDMTPMSDPSDYWGSVEFGSGSFVTQMFNVSVTSDQVFTSQPSSITLPPGTLRPSSPVAVVVHSTPRQLASVTSQKDGSLYAEVSFPDDLDGYHTLHVLGTTPSGEKVDFYKPVVVANDGGYRGNLPRQGAVATQVTEGAGAQSGVEVSPRFDVPSEVSTAKSPTSGQDKSQKNIARWIPWVAIIVVLAVIVAGLVCILLRRRKV